MKKRGYLLVFFILIKYKIKPKKHKIMNEKENKATISQRDLGLISGYSKTTIQNLAARGKLPTNENGELLREECIKILAERRKKKDLSDNESAKLLLKSRALKAEQAAKLEAKKNKIAELAIKQKEKNLIAVDSAYNVFSRKCEEVRGELENIPARLALELEGLPAAAIEKKLREAISEALLGISEEKKKEALQRLKTD